MSALEEFRSQVKLLMQQADQADGQGRPTGAEMQELQGRFRVFEQLSNRLVEQMVRPRLEAVAGFFPNAVADRHTLRGHATWWFGYCERFPVTTKLDFGFAHDDQIDRVYLNYDLYIRPSFVRYDRFDRLVLSLKQADDGIVANWVEQKLLEFTKTYLHLEATDRDQATSFATDPVCGMRINKDQTAGHLDYVGHRFFFCAQSCMDEFSANPDHFAKIVT